MFQASYQHHLLTNNGYTFLQFRTRDVLYHKVIFFRGLPHRYRFHFTRTMKRVKRALSVRRKAASPRGGWGSCKSASFTDSTSERRPRPPYSDVSDLRAAFILPKCQSIQRDTKCHNLWREETVHFGETSQVSKTVVDAIRTSTPQYRQIVSNTEYAIPPWTSSL